MRIAFVLYDGFTALDVIGPYEVLSRLPGAEIHFVSTSSDPVRADMGLTVTPSATTATLRDLDVLVVGGASDPIPVLRDEPLLQWIRETSRDATWVVSVCSGALLLAAAGVLQGRMASTHWGVRDNLAAMGVEVVKNRVFFDGKFVSGAGVSAGIEVALELIARIAGEETAKALQLSIEYDPQPLYQSGAPEKASAATLRMATRMLLGDNPLAAVRTARHLLQTRLRRAVKRIRSRPHRSN